MNEIVHLEVPDELVRQARDVATRTQRPVADVFLEWLKRGTEDIPIHMLPDDQVLAMRDAQLSDEQQAELSELLAAQREGTLDDTGRWELQRLMNLYRTGMVRKAEAQAVAVARGLQPPLQ